MTSINDGIPADLRYRGYVISQIPSQMICTRGMRPTQIRKCHSHRRSPPIPLVSVVGVVMGFGYLCHGGRQDTASALYMPVFCKCQEIRTLELGFIQIILGRSGRGYILSCCSHRVRRVVYKTW